MADYSFYLHEDEWAMINIMPAENFSRAREVAVEAQTFSQEHFDGQGWTGMYVIPKETHPIRIRQISLSTLQDLFLGYLAPVSQLETGYSTYREAVRNGFALVGERFGVLYGSCQEEIVTGLHVAHFVGEDVEGVEQFIDRVVSVGKEFNLMLADWWQHRIVDLQNRSEVARYILGDEDGEAVVE
jgi:hypothetical protein